MNPAVLVGWTSIATGIGWALGPWALIGAGASLIVSVATLGGER